MSSHRQRRALLRALGVCAAAALLVVPSALPQAADTIVTVAGTGKRGSAGEGHPATEASLDRPRSVAATPDGGFVWTEPASHRVRKVGPDGIVTTIAGTGVAGFSGDGGPATAAHLDFVHGVSVHPAGGYLISDFSNNRIRRIRPDGRIVTVAGIGQRGYTGDGGPATAARIGSPRGVTALPDGGFLIPDSDNNVVRRVLPNGTITTVAGTSDEGFSGDGGPATSARLTFPFAVSPTADGGFLVADAANQRIRKVGPDGIITTVAGNGVQGASGDGGPATAASLSNPHDVLALPDGGFLIADTSNHRIRRVAPDGTISTLVGTGAPGFAGDGGAAVSARLRDPKGIAMLPNGRLFIADEQNDRIRSVGLPSRPVSVRRPSIQGTLGIGKTLAAHAGGWRGYGTQFEYVWQRCRRSGGSCATIAGARSARYKVRKADFGRSLRVRVIGSTPAGSSVAVSPPTKPVAMLVTRTFPVTGSESDGYAYRWERPGGVTRPTTSTTDAAVVVGRSATPQGVLASVGLLRFDTSAIPRNARVESVRLRFAVLTLLRSDGQLVVEPYPAASWPIGVEDFAARPQRKVVGTFPLIGMPVEGNADLELDRRAVSLGRNGSALRLLVPGRSTTKTQNAVNFASADHGSLRPPTLVVTYSTT